MITQTRLKIVLIGLSLGLIEGMGKVAFPTFPIVETFGFQAAIVGAYLAARTTSGIKNMGMEKKNGQKETD